MHVNLIHGGEVVHVGQEHVNFDGFIDTCARSLQYGSKVLNDIMLCAMSAYMVPTSLERHLKEIAYSVSLDVTFLDLHGVLVKCNHSRAEDHAIRDNGLVVDAQKGLGRLGCVDWSFVWHDALVKKQY